MVCGRPIHYLTQKKSASGRDPGIARIQRQSCEFIWPNTPDDEFQLHMSTPSAVGVPRSGRLGAHLGLAPHISYLNVWSLLSSATVCLSLLVFLNAAQPFLLDLLHVPSDRSGALTGRLILFDQLCALTAALVWGALADRLGIRVVIPAGYLLVATGLGTYALASRAGQLVWFRLVFAVSGSSIPARLICGDFEPYFGVELARRVARRP